MVITTSNCFAAFATFDINLLHLNALLEHVSQRLTCLLQGSWSQPWHSLFKSQSDSQDVSTFFD
jgi:hypothetical protein